MADFNPDEYLAQNSAATSAPPQVPVDQTQVDQFDPVAYAKNAQTESVSSAEKALQASHGDIPHQLEALKQGINQGLTGGLSDFIYSTPEQRLEAQKVRAANPWTYTAGQVVGSIPLLALTGGAAAPVEAGLIARGVGPIAARAAGFGAEGALFGAGNAISDFALSDRSLGDPHAVAQKVLADVGIGAALGSGFGVLSKGIEAIPSLKRIAEKPAEITMAAAAEEALPKAVKGVTPSSLEELEALDKQASFMGQAGSEELPQKAPLVDAASRVSMNNPITSMQAAALDSPEKMAAYQVDREMPGEIGEQLRRLELRQRKELTAQNDFTINSLSPEAAPTSDAVEGGNRAIKTFTDQYQAEKKALGPVFDEIKKTPISQGFNHLPGMIKSMTDAVPGVSRMFDTAGDELAIKPYSSKWGIDEATYRAVKEAVSSAKEGIESFEELANIRKGLSQHVDVLSQGEAPREIRAIKASLMDYMQDLVNRSTVNQEVRDVFKRYAINEQERGVIEKVFGASVGNPEFGAISKIKPENILDRIFSNTANVKAAKTILEPKAFSEMLSNWLSENRAKVTDNNVFSSRKWGSFLKRNQDALGEAFRDNPATFQRLKDINTISQIIPDAPSINPSGTAKTFWRKLLSEPSAEGLLKNLTEKGKELLTERATAARINAELAGKADQVAKISYLRNSIEKATEKINSAAKSISLGNPIKKELIPAAVSVGDREYNERVKNIEKAKSDPHAFLDSMTKKTYALNQAAPNVTVALHSTLNSALEFLSSKIPRPSEQMFLSQKFEPNETQKRTFNNYYNAVAQPLSAFHEISQGTLTSQTMEALHAVHPQLLQEMQHAVMGSLKADVAKDLPYGKKIAIAKFLESPLDENMTPAVVLSNQNALNAPSLSQQALPQEGRKSQALGPMKNIKMSSRIATRTQKEEEET